MVTAAITPPEAPDLAGMQIGRYEVGRTLGQGAMGAVYEAIDTDLERTVALKILSADLDPGHLVYEARICAALEHDHIVRVYEVRKDDTITYLAMQRIDGGPLATPEPPLDRKLRKPHARGAVEIALQITQGVDFAHRHGILHRDLKPANVLVDSERRAFVSDFGLAAHASLTAGAVLAPAGTPPYMAPEVWEGKPGAASTAADIWGLGVILYELLSGHRPFNGNSMAELKRQVIMEPPAPLAAVDPDLAAVYLHCLEKDPSRRYATAGALAVDLAHILANEPISQEARPRGRCARARRHAARHPMIAALSALFVAAALLAAFNALSLLRAREAAFRGADVTARSLARVAAAQFERYTMAVEAAGKDPRVALALADPSSSKGSAECARLFAEALGPFSKWYLLDESGKMVGHAPDVAHNVMGRSFQFRDYFRGAQELENTHVRTAYVSRAYRSEGDDGYEIAISFAVHDNAGRWIGLLAAALPTGAAFASVDLDDPGDTDFTASLLSPRGRERDQSSPSPDLVFLQRRTLPQGEAPSAGTMDGLGADYGDSGLVRRVPVRGTPFSVLVRVAYDRPLADVSPALRRTAQVPDDRVGAAK